MVHTTFYEVSSTITENQSFTHFW